MNYSTSHNYEAGTGGTGIGALKVAKKLDNSLAVFANLAAIKTYYAAKDKPKTGFAVVTGTVSGEDITGITAAWTWDKKLNDWQPVATNFVGAKGASGADGISIKDVKIVNGRFIVTLTNNATIDAGEAPKGVKGDKGVGVKTAAVVNGRLKITLTDDSVIDAGAVGGGGGGSDDHPIVFVTSFPPIPVANTLYVKTG